MKGVSKYLTFMHFIKHSEQSVRKLGFSLLYKEHVLKG